MLDPFLSHLITDTRALALKYWRTGFEIETKPDKTLVTQADREVEALIRARIGAAFPNDGIWGEEYGTHALTADRIWVIDPIDGTQAFVMGIPVFSTLIALIVGGQVVQAVADFPAMDMLASAVRGQGACLNATPLHVSACQDLGVANLTATSITMFSGHEQAFDRLMRRAGQVRFGLDAYGFCAVARGRADLVVEADLKPHDYLAPSLIIAESGG